MNHNLYSIFIFKTYQDFKLLICYFYLNVSSELFHNKVVKQSIALESQDSFGWRIRWWRFNSNGDVDLCPEERTEARLLIPSLTTRLYLSNCFHSQFLQAWRRAIQFFSHYNSSADRPQFQSLLGFFLSLQTENASCFHTLQSHPNITDFSILQLKARESHVKISKYWISKSRQTHLENKFKTRIWVCQLGSGPQKAHTDYTIPVQSTRSG